jgi:hypothetical protein
LTKIDVAEAHIRAAVRLFFEGENPAPVYALANAAVRAHLGLHGSSSWIILNELNDFIWPGRDIYPIPGGRRDQYEYGLLPRLLFKRVIDAILALDDKKKRVNGTPRLRSGGYPAD